MKATTEQLVNVIPWDVESETSKAGISRRSLAKALGVSDRVVRKLIEAARVEGYFIINDQDGYGYYQSSDLDVLERQYKQDTARAMSILTRRKWIRKYLRDNGRNVK